jgi:hypothetical protein
LLFFPGAENFKTRLKVISAGANGNIPKRSGNKLLEAKKVRSRAQSILEYVIIMGVVAAAVVAMQVYFRRAVNARLEEIKQEYVPRAIP